MGSGEKAWRSLSAWAQNEFPPTKIVCFICGVKPDEDCRGGVTHDERYQEMADLVLGSIAILTRTGDV